MATLNTFLRTGQLGQVCLGMNPFDAESILGEPTKRSRKSNPLELYYGPLRLTFWKHKDSPRPQLMEIELSFSPTDEQVPEVICFTDIDTTRPISEKRFRSFLHEIQYLPIHLVDDTSSRQLVLPSNVVVDFVDGKVCAIRISQQRTKEKTPSTLSGYREPSREQIDAMLTEAQVLMDGGHDRAALLVAWSGLEAVLRRVAVEEGYKGRVHVQSSILLRELASTQLIPPSELAWLEQMRQVRTSAAHGLAPEPVDKHMVEKITRFAKFLLGFRETI